METVGQVVGQAVGQDVTIVLLYRGDICYELELIKDVKQSEYNKQGWSLSHIRLLCETGKLIAIKLGRDWFVDKYLSYQYTLATRQDAS